MREILLPKSERIIRDLGDFAKRASSILNPVQQRPQKTDTGTPPGDARRRFGVDANSKSGALGSAPLLWLASL
jgi:hypothetical protein